MLLGTLQIWVVRSLVTWSVKGSILHLSCHCPFPVPSPPYPPPLPDTLWSLSSRQGSTYLNLSPSSGSIPLNLAHMDKNLHQDAWQVNNFAAAPRTLKGWMGVVWPFSRGLISNGRAFSLRAMVICDCSNVQRPCFSHRDSKQDHQQKQPHSSEPERLSTSCPGYVVQTWRFPTSFWVRKRNVIFTPDARRLQTLLF